MQRQRSVRRQHDRHRFFAVIDGGIDATHPAFLDRKKEERQKAHREQERERSFTEECLKFSRVARTYDFTSCGTSLLTPGNPQGWKDPNSEVSSVCFRIKNNKDALAHLQTVAPMRRDLDWES